MDSRNENFKLSKAYEHKINIVNVITAPEIEILIILSELKYNSFKRSGKKPSDFCKIDLKMHNVKTYDFVRMYFNDSSKLVNAIKDYRKVSNIPNGEYSLNDLLRL